MYLIITVDFFHNPKVPELFRNSSGTKTEKLKNWKTEFSIEIQEEILHMDSVFQFFSFLVFQFFSFSVF